MITAIMAAAINLDPSKGYVIGDGNRLPWHCHEELKHFKNTTLGHVLLMGRKTYQSLPTKPLPNRKTIILSKQPLDLNEKEQGLVFVANDVESALKCYRNIAAGYQDLFVCGGKSVYEQLMPMCNGIILSCMRNQVYGNVGFTYDEMAKLIPEELFVEESIKNYDDFCVVEYRRVLLTINLI